MTTLIQPPPPGYRKWWWIPATLLVVTLLVGAGLWLSDLLEDNGCGGDLDRNESGQCVGLTDGSEQFTDDIADLAERIRDENRIVVDSGDPYVSIVLLTPMTTGDSDEGNVTTAGIRHRLAGAHLAQLTANHTPIWSGDSPKIRLLLANPGSDFDSGESVVGTIEQRRTDDRIVAVTGISFSFEKALATVEKLTTLEEPMPVFASTLTIDHFERKRSFLKVSPPATEHARAAAEFLAEGDEKVLIVRDDNPADQYGRTLADAFAAQFPENSPDIAEEAIHYDAGEGPVSIAFANMRANICYRKPSTIYFAGRGADALEFLIQLAQRHCRDEPIQVFTADDMPYHQLADNIAGKALEANITVRYTGLVHPDAWNDDHNGFSDFAIDPFLRECEGPICYREFSDGNVHDFAAVMEHDAVIVAVQAIRNAAAENVVDSGAVFQAMGQLNGVSAVDGASGKLDIVNSVPRGKPILILEARNGLAPLYLGTR